MKNPLREHLRLTFIEVKRIVMRKHILLAMAIALWCVYRSLVYKTHLGLYGIVASVVPDEFLNCFIVAFGGAAALAVDTETGFLGLALSRNIRRWHHILHKIVAIWVVITAITIVQLVLMYVVAAFFMPWDVPHVAECQRYLELPSGERVCVLAPNAVEATRGPFPALFVTHPVLNDIIGMAMVSVGTSVTALLGVFAAACGANAYIAMSTPVLVTITIALFLHPFLPYWADPTALGDVFRGTYTDRTDAWHWFPVALGWTVVLTVLSMLIAEKRELAVKGDGE